MIIRKNVKLGIKSKARRSLPEIRRKRHSSFYSAIQRDIRDIERKIYRIKKALKYYSEGTITQEIQEIQEIFDEETRKKLGKVGEESDKLFDELTSELLKSIEDPTPEDVKRLENLEESDLILYKTTSGYPPNNTSDFSNLPKRSNYRRRNYYADESKNKKDKAKEELLGLLSGLGEIYKSEYESISEAIFSKKNKNGNVEKRYSSESSQMVEEIKTVDDLRKVMNNVYTKLGNIQAKVTTGAVRFWYGLSGALTVATAALMYYLDPIIKLLGTVQGAIINIAQKGIYAVVEILLTGLAAIITFLIATGLRSSNKQKFNELTSGAKSKMKSINKEIIKNPSKENIQLVASHMSAISNFIQENPKVSIKVFEQQVFGNLNKLEAQLKKRPIDNSPKKKWYQGILDFFGINKKRK